MSDLLVIHVLPYSLLINVFLVIAYCLKYHFDKRNEAQIGSLIKGLGRDVDNLTENVDKLIAKKKKLSDELNSLKS